MSKYTTEVRFICEESAGLTDSVGYKSINDIITVAIPQVFNFDFPIFDEAYRPVLERKILRHFYTREICEETVGLWKLRLEDKLNVIMPYYNKLYESELIKFNPLYDVDLSTTHLGEKNETTADKNKYKSVSERERENDSENVSQGKSKAEDIRVTNETEKGNGSERNNAWDLYSDTPQGGINGILGNPDNADPSLRGMSYLTNARNNFGDGSNQYERGNQNESVNKSNNTDESKSNLTVKEINKDVNSSTDDRNKTSQNLENYLEKVHGKRGSKSFSALLLEYRSTFLNIDAMILEELEPLFMQLW